MANRVLSVLGVAVLSAACYPPAPSSACVEVGVGAGRPAGSNPVAPSGVMVTADCRGNSLVNQPGPVTAGGGEGGEGGGGGESTNHPPSVFVDASPTRVSPGGMVTLTAQAVDPDGDPVTYAWTAAAGTLACPDCRTTIWTAPTDTLAYVVRVDVADGRGGAATGTTIVTVTTE